MERGEAEAGTSLGKGSKKTDPGQKILGSSDEMNKMSSGKTNKTEPGS